MQEYNHDMSCLTTYYIKHSVFADIYGIDPVSKGPIIIGNDVWIATGSTVLSGVTIGNGAVVAANSVVTSDVPPYAVVGGSPAKILKYRFTPDIIAVLQEIEWWNWDINRIKRNKHLFYNEVTLENLSRIID
jgi:acetyltransferase-like isoleucine patch superfamily enzyme